MKHAINTLLNNTDVLCHEVRVNKNTDTDNWLLHFFLCHDKDGGKPYFAMGYEHYTKTLSPNRYFATPLAARSTLNDTRAMDNTYTPTTDKTLDKEWSEETSYGYLAGFGMITQADNDNLLFNQYTASHTSSLYPTSESVAQTTTLNTALGSDTDLLDDSIPRTSRETLLQDANGLNDASLNPSNRHIREMDDTPVYAGTTNRDTSVGYDLSKDTNYQANDGKSFHGIWNADIHFSKTHEVDRTEFLYLFNKYKAYIGKTVDTHLEPESKFNVEMEQIFGASFDMERIKTNMFRRDETVGNQHANTDNHGPVSEVSDFLKRTAHNIKEKITAD